MNVVLTIDLFTNLKIRQHT